MMRGVQVRCAARALLVTVAAAALLATRGAEAQRKGTIDATIRQQQQQSAYDAEKKRKEEEEAAAAAEQQRRQAAATNLRSLVGMDPTRMATRRVKRLRPVRCDVVAGDEGGSGCTKLLEGPAILLSATFSESQSVRSAFGSARFGKIELAAFVTGGMLTNDALSWWTVWDGLSPLVLAPDEVLYIVGELKDNIGRPGATVTFYRP